MAAGTLAFYRMRLRFDPEGKGTTSKYTKLHKGNPVRSSAAKIPHRGDSIPHLFLMRIPKRGFT
jgi:hypothetical protein